jgi:hypothetical protein
MLISRVATVRTALLKVAALVRCATDPDRECIAVLHTLLTSGCNSPLLLDLPGPGVCLRLPQITEPPTSDSGTRQRCRLRDGALSDRRAAVSR